MDAGRLAQLAHLAHETGVPGAVLGVLSDGALEVAPYGVLSTRTGVETTADSVFQIGSITKTWTATMVAQLVAEGRLSYDEPVDLVPGGVSVRQLLAHSSGLPGDVFTDTGRGDDCLERYVEALGPPLLPPGAAYSYCNSGFVVLGRLIELLDERTWDESLRARLVEPLGLTDTVTLPEEAVLRRTAVGHHAPPDDARPYDTWGLPRALGPAGLITCSAGDLLTYARVHLDRGGDLLGAADVEAMWVEQLPIPDPEYDGIGLAWRLATWSGQRVLAHDGGTIGQSAMLRLLPDLGVAVCLLTNSANGGALADRLLPEVLGEVAGVEVPPAPAPDPGARPPGIARHAGTYRRAGMLFEVRVTDGEMRIAVRADYGIEGFDEESEPILVHPVDESGDRFVGRSDDAQAWWPVAFGTLPDGRAHLYSSGRVNLRD